MREEMQKLETSLKGKEVFADQAIERLNQANNALFEARNSLKLAQVQHQKELIELKNHIDAEMRQKIELVKGEAVENYKFSPAFEEAIEKTIMLGVEIGMSIYRVALKSAHPDLDLNSLDEEFLQSFPKEDEVAAQPLSPVIKIIASPDQQLEDLPEHTSTQPLAEDLFAPAPNQQKIALPPPSELEIVPPPPPPK